MVPERIMIVDDNKVLLKELQETLDLCGYDTKAVSESSSVFRLARLIKPDAILLDLNMPGASGFEVADKLKQNKTTSRIPIIAISGYFPIDKQGVLLEKRNMDRLIKKPFEIAELIMEIETVLNKGGAIGA